MILDRLYLSINYGFKDSYEKISWIIRMCLYFSFLHYWFFVASVVDAFLWIALAVESAKSVGGLHGEAAFQRLISPWYALHFISAVFSPVIAPRMIDFNIRRIFIWNRSSNTESPTKLRTITFCFWSETYLGGGGGVDVLLSQGFDPLPAQRVPLCAILRYPYLVTAS